MKINVLYIAHQTFYWGGAAKSLCNLISSVSEYVNPIVLVSDEGDVTEYLRANNIKYFVYPIPYLHTPTGLILYCRKWCSYLYREWKGVRYIASLLRNENIQIIHSNASIFTFGYSLAKYMKVKHVWHVREYLDLDYNIKVLIGRKKLERLINKSDARIAISTSIAEYWHMDTDGRYIIGNAVRKCSETEYNPLKHKYVLFCAAGLIENKGTQFCVEAFCKSGIFRKGYKLVMCGHCQTEYKQYLYSIAQEYGAQNSLDIRSFCDDLKSLYINASAYIMASKCEALGRVTIEAMFYGCPVIARNSGGTTDIVTHNKTGYLFDTMEECVTYLQRVIEQNNESMILEAQEFVKRNYSEDVYGTKIINVYKSIL